MNLNIGCSSPGCTNPVIGQCVGYKGSCGRYYCATHTSERLCPDCARQKLQDELATKTYKDYLQVSEQVDYESGLGFLWITLPAYIAIATVSFTLIKWGDPLLALVPLLGGLVILWTWFHKAKQNKEVVTIINGDGAVIRRWGDVEPVVDSDKGDN